MAGGATQSGRTVTSKVTAILMAFSRGSTHSLTELASLTGLPVSTTHRLANELAVRRLLERTDDGGYRVGLPLRMIAGWAPPMLGPASNGRSPSEPIWDRALSAMTDLAAATRSSVRLGLLDGPAVWERHVRPGAPPSTVVVSSRPAHTTALGRTLLAFSPPTVVEQVLAGERPPDGLRRSLATIRLSHVAVLRGAIAMPVFGAGGTLLAALELGDAPAGARAALAVVTGSLSRTLATRPMRIQAVAYHS